MLNRSNLSSSGSSQKNLIDLQEINDSLVKISQPLGDLLRELNRVADNDYFGPLMTETRANQIELDRLAQKAALLGPVNGRPPLDPLVQSLRDKIQAVAKFVEALAPPPRPGPNRGSYLDMFAPRRQASA